jgi:hypothetical protein
MLNRQAIGILAIALALPAFANETSVRRPPARNVIELKPLSPRGTDVVERGTDVVELEPLSTAPISIRLTANADVVYKTICKLAGINVVIDPDFRPQKLTLELTDVTLNEALEIVRLQSKTVWRRDAPDNLRLPERNPLITRAGRW